MSGIAGSLFTSHVLMPLMAVLMGIVAYFVAKKNKVLKNKKLITYVIAGSFLLCLPGFFGLIDYWFMPYAYFGLQIFYLLLGWLSMSLVMRFLPQSRGGEPTPFYVKFIIQFLMMFIGAAFFSLIFNLFNELQYGIWASTCLLTFLLPLLFRQTYYSYINIPLEIYKVWKYSDTNDLSSFELLDYNRLQVIELEVFKQATDTAPTKVKAKVPDNMKFGIWFQKFLIDYNTKFPSTPIDVRDDNSSEPYSWIFYTKSSFFSPRKYIDYEMDITKNEIKEKHTIIVKRVSEQTNEEVKTKA